MSLRRSSILFRGCRYDYRDQEFYECSTIYDTINLTKEGQCFLNVPETHINERGLFVEQVNAKIIVELCATAQAAAN